MRLSDTLAHLIEEARAIGRGLPLAPDAHPGVD
jgi:hypothetical protein